MTSTKPIVNLDFDQIKSDIINYIKTDQTFTDYNFEGSALNAIIDVLAYNTHTNAYYANMVHNEGFIDTAQNRASVVSKAKELGYTPRSSTGAVALLNITVTNSVDNILYIPRGTIFTSYNDNGSYLFITTEDASSVTVGNTKVFTNLKVVEGSYVSNSFRVDTMSNVKSVFNIPNASVDISTLKVYVRDSISSVEVTEYNRVTDIYNLNATSNVYYIQESYAGSFQIFFGQNVIGKQPINDNIITINYVSSTNSKLANDCKTFEFNSFYGTITNVSTVQASYGGSDKESINSIKYNAVNAYSTKHRAVTTNDYSAMLKEKFSFIKSVNVWGGEVNSPPIYGKVFMSIQPVTNYVLTEDVKRNLILPAIKKVSVLTVMPEFIEPAYTDIEFVTNIKFNSNKTLSTKASVETTIKATIREYIDSISVFNSDYLHSVLTNKLAILDTGISSIDVTKRIGFKILPFINKNTKITHILNNAVVQGSISSSKFRTFVNGKIITTSIKEITNSRKVTINTLGENEIYISLGIYNESNILIRTIGTVNLSKGIFDINLTIYGYLTDTHFIYLRCSTSTSDLLVAHNQIISLRPDFEDAAIGIMSNNIVNTTVYAK